jgi:hypothetical protein
VGEGLVEEEEEEEVAEEESNNIEIVKTPVFFYIRIVNMNIKEANQKLGLENNIKNLIFVYCSPKVGSTSLVSSLNLYALKDYAIFHIHNEVMLKVLYGITDVSINDIIAYNATLCKKVFVIDIFRTPVEQKISMFFEDITTHFNVAEGDVDKLPMTTLFSRFNHIYPHIIPSPDFYQNTYPIPAPSAFDFNARFISATTNNITYIKLRLMDSLTHWAIILKEILSIGDIKILKDYTSASKIFKDTFIEFKREYRIPDYIFEEHVNKPSFYLSEEENAEYIQKWRGKMVNDIGRPYDLDEYKLYMRISCENKTVRDVIQSAHYIDSGCACRYCFAQRRKITTTGTVQKIVHVPPPPPRPILLYVKPKMKKHKLKSTFDF